MADDSFDEFMVREFPFRPDHPDYERLREIIDQIEEWKAARKKAEEVYAGIVDVYSMVYMGVNRAGLNLPKTPANSGTVANSMGNAWSEGFLFGVLYERLGGHREAV